MDQISGVKVFSSTMAHERERLGERIALWLEANPGVRIVDKVVLQSSDLAFHCLSVTLFYADAEPARRRRTTSNSVA